MGKKLENALTYAGIANDLKAEILSKYNALGTFFPDFELKFGSFLKDLRGGFEVSIEPSDSAFEYIPAEDKVRLFSGGLEMIHENLSARDDIPDLPGIRGMLLRQGVEIYTLHEVRHVTQGITNFPQVQSIKEIAGTDTLGKLDLVADIDAAKIHAGVLTLRERDWDEKTYLRYLKDCVFFCGEIGLNVFRAPASKPHKVRRVLGLAITALRIEQALPLFDIAGTDALKVPLDSAIWPEFGVEGPAQLFQITPTMAMLETSVPIPSADLRALVENFDTRSFAEIYLALRQLYRA